MQCSLNSIATGPLSGAERAGEPETGATVFRHPQTHPDPVRQFPQVSGSPLDSLRRKSTDRIRMACKRSGVRIPIAPLVFLGQSLVLRSSRAFQDRLTVI